MGADHKHLNLIEKYDLNEDTVLRIDRIKDYEQSEEVLYYIHEISGRSMRFPYVYQFSCAIDIDRHGRIWVLSFEKQPPPGADFNRESVQDVLVFEVYSPEGNLLQTIPFEYYIQDMTFKI